MNDVEDNEEMMKHDYEMSDYKMSEENEPTILQNGDSNFTEIKNSSNNVHLATNFTVFDKSRKNTSEELSG